MAEEIEQFIHVIIVAAGLGRRFNSTNAKPKQYQLIDDLSVLEHSIKAFDDIAVVGITVVIHPEDKHWQTIQPIASKHTVKTTFGGTQRHDSVRNGIKSLQANPKDWVLVHDAARPCVTSDEINDLIDDCLSLQRGGLLVTPVADTIKYSESGDVVNKTINRNHLYAALTPQLFRCGELLKALTVFEAGSITDESSALEAQGQKPIMVMGKSSNIKITTQDDLAMATSILKLHGRIQ